MSPVPPPGKSPKIDGDNNNADENNALATIKIQCFKGCTCKSKDQVEPFNQGFHSYEIDPRSTEAIWFCPTCAAIRKSSVESINSGSRTRSSKSKL